ncbi:TDT family transporter [Vibrio sp. 99-70-13A1]|uniref:TDT family transporter n=1 Tax=Vibrio sp. 99-70-13A1 TaxID=2607601 RepID=UPI0014939E32|nr:TDT family transporter [Vibrio sp. 99-70-13A1]NOH98031.1 TDT family transporter [Vibrio sp. 99-70-13A1]
MAGLALAIASLGWCWDGVLVSQGVLHTPGVVQWVSSAIAASLLLILAVKFLIHGHLLREDLAHPVVGSVVPTFAMGCMIVSASLAPISQFLQEAVWLASVALHVVFLVSFLYHRAKQFEIHHMVPSWFVPPIGIIVADVSFSGNPTLQPVANVVLMFGLIVYAVMLPLMIYRLMFRHEIPDAAKPTIAIMAAPASLSLAGYLTVSANPSPVIISLLFGIAVLMTFIIYVAFLKLLRLPFSPGYAAFTFPMVIGATALFKMAAWMQGVGIDAQFINQIYNLAYLELVVATSVVTYVAVRYYMNYQPHRLFRVIENRF